jgi:C-methyltransferase C-terminal domain
VCELDAGLVRFVADLNPDKQGKLLPGVRIPVEAPESLAQQGPDYCLLFAWNLADEIVAQQSEYLHRGGRFVAPVPAPRVVAG